MQLSGPEAPRQPGVVSGTPSPRWPVVPAGRRSQGDRGEHLVSWPLCPLAIRLAVALLQCGGFAGDWIKKGEVWCVLPPKCEEMQGWACRSVAGG